MPSRSLLLVPTVFLLALPAAAQPISVFDASLENLVDAADGRLALYAREIASRKELSMNGGIEAPARHLFGVLLAEAALAKRRAAGLPTELTIPYPEDGYRGQRGRLRSRHGDSWTLPMLLEAMLHDDDPAATDLILSWVGAEFPSWLRAAGLETLAAPTSHLDEDRAVLVLVDSRFASVSPLALERWFWDRQTKEIVPLPFSEDPRRDGDFALKLGAARQHRDRAGVNRMSLRTQVDILERLVAGTLGHPEDDEHLRRILATCPSILGADELPIHLQSSGVDAVTAESTASAMIVKGSKGTMIAAIAARGYGDSAAGLGLVRTMGRGAVRRLLPGNHDGPPLIVARLRGFRWAMVTDTERAEALATRAARNNFEDDVRITATSERSIFGPAETPILHVAATVDRTIPLIAQWRHPDGTKTTTRRLFLPGAEPSLTVAGPDGKVGSWGVSAAFDGQVVLEASFQRVGTVPAEKQRRFP